MRTTATGGGAPGFNDCRDPECDACRATRYYGVSWSAEKCINVGFDPDLNRLDLLDALWRPADNTTIEGDDAQLDGSLDHVADGAL